MAYLGLMASPNRSKMKVIWSSGNKEGNYNSQKTLFLRTTYKMNPLVWIEDVNEKKKSVISVHIESVRASGRRGRWVDFRVGAVLSSRPPFQGRVRVRINLGSSGSIDDNVITAWPQLAKSWDKSME